MPTTIATGSPNDVKVRWKEQYVSEGLNRKFVGVAPRGVLRGGRLSTAGAGLQVTVGADPDVGDSVYVYEDRVNGFNLTYRQAGSFNLDLTPAASTTVYVCLYVEYLVSIATVVEWRTYTEAELFGGAPVAEAGSVVILGRVVVPGVGPIPAANVTPDRRRTAWDGTSPGAVPWTQVVENGSFHIAAPSGSAASVNELVFPGWTPGLVGATDTIDVSTASPRTGAHEVEFPFNAGGAIGTSLLGDGVIPVTPGQWLRGQVWLRFDTFDYTTPGPTPFIGLLLTFLDSSMSPVANELIGVDPSTLTLPLTQAYTEYTGTVEAPATAAYVRVGLVAVELGGGGSGSSGSVFFDDVRVFVEPTSVTEADIAGALQSIASVRKKSLSTVADFFNSAIYAILNSSGELEVDRGDSLAAGTLGATDWLATLFGRLAAARGMVSGKSLADTIAESNRARFEADLDGTSSPGRYVCLFRSNNEPGTKRFCIFLDTTDDSIWLTHNADTTAADVTNLRYASTDTATALVIGANFTTGGAGMRILTAISGTAGNVIDFLAQQDAYETERFYNEIAGAAAGTNNYLLLWRIGLGGESVRLYASEGILTGSQSGFVITTNAEYDNSAATWQKDDIATESAGWYFSTTAIGLTRAAGAGTWTDVLPGGAGWTKYLYSFAGLGGDQGRQFLPDGYIAFQGATTLGGNPSSIISPIRNAVYPKIIPKMIAKFTITGGGAPVIDTDQSYNVLSVTNNGAAGIDVVARTDWDDNDCVVFLCGNRPALSPTAAGRAATLWTLQALSSPGDTVTITGYDLFSGGVFDFSSGAYTQRVYAIVYAPDTQP